MKKILVLIFILIILFSFTSCDNEKAIDNAISEMEERTIAFMNTLSTVYDYKIFLETNDKFYITWDLSKYNPNETTETYNNKMKVLMTRLIEVNTGDITYNITEAKGELTLTREANTEVNIKAMNVIIKYKLVDGTEKTLFVNGNLYYYKNTGETTTEKYDLHSLRVNGKEYMPFSTVIQDGKFTSALYNGKTVNCDILNASNFYINVLV